MVKITPYKPEEGENTVNKQALDMIGNLNK